MSTKMELIKGNLELIRLLAKKHKALSIALFGSVSRGQDTPESDIDFLVEFAPDASLLDQAGLMNDLTELLNCKVDVISRGGLRKSDSEILKDIITL